MNTIHRFSFAKVNIGLFVKGKRPDGFHEVETVLQQIDLRDELEVSLRADTQIILSCNKPEIPTNEDNLCVRAARLFFASTGRSYGLNIRLTKTIPAGAGLGGGSSNAANTLLALNELTKSGLGSEQIQTMAAQIGSDVPFFVRGGIALARGRGELLVRLGRRLSDRPLLVVFPGIFVSTQWAYHNLNLNLTKSKKNTNLSSFRDRGVCELDFFKFAANHFESVVFSRYPELQKIKERMLSAGALYASLSGSGSAVFGVFAQQKEIKAARESLPKHYEAFEARFSYPDFSDD